MTYSEAIEFLYQLRWFGAKLGLANTFKLASLAGNPHERLRFIHVAGTNGKGSTCAMLESIYRAAGLRVGLFTSPHLVAFGERIQVDRQPISEFEVVRLVEEMREFLQQGWPTQAPVPGSAHAEHGGSAGIPASPAQGAVTQHPADRNVGGPHSGGEEHPTFFEVVTVMALRYFAARGCDLVIWETGLGGRLDATNIVTPLASVITNIQFDHQQWLGETLASIAREKAGIIKNGVPALTTTDAPEALEVLTATAHERTAPLTIIPAAAADAPPIDLLPLPLLGHHQRLNAALALATVHALSAVIPVSEPVWRAGLSSVHWAGRLQLVHRPDGQRILLDGAHNVAGAEILAAALQQYFPAERTTLLLGILRDKDWPGMCRILAPLASKILLVPVHSERSASAHELAQACLNAHPVVQVRECASVPQALEAATRDPFLTIAGSLYLIGEAMELLGLSPANGKNERGLNEWVPPQRPASVLART